MDIQKAFAANLRKYRKAAGLTQEELAERCGLHRTYIGGIEQGRINVCLRNVGKMADALGVRPMLLLAEREGDGLSEELEELRKLRTHVHDFINNVESYSVYSSDTEN